MEDGDAAGAQGPLDLGGEAVRVERVVEDVGELEVEGGVGEGLGVEAPQTTSGGAGARSMPTAPATPT